MNQRNRLAPSPAPWLAYTPALRVWVPAIAAVALCLITFGCEDEPETKPGVDPNLPPANVSLPSIPADLGVPKIPDKLGDGSFTVNGLRRNRQANLEKPIAVTGVIDWVYDCPHWEDEKDKKKRRRRRRRANAEEEAPKMCERPHFYITDKPGGEDKLMIVSIVPHYKEKFDEGEIKVGDQHTIMGTYTDLGDGFTAAEAGLIIMTDIKGLEPTEEDEEEKKKKR